MWLSGSSGHGGVGIKPAVAGGGGGERKHPLQKGQEVRQPHLLLLLHIIRSYSCFLLICVFEFSLANKPVSLATLYVEGLYFYIFGSKKKPLESSSICYTSDLSRIQRAINPI